MVSFDTVRINQLDAVTTAWLRDVLTALDAKDVDAYVAAMSDDVEVVFNNGDTAMRGRQVVRDGLAQFWRSFDTLAHEELNIYGTDRNLVHEALNHYTTVDGRRVTVRAVAWIDRDDDGLITSLRVYNDQTPLWAQPE